MNEFLANAKANAMQVPSEIEALEQRVIELKPKVILEIGTASGGTIGRWLSIPGVETVISIDLADGIHGGQSQETRTQVIEACAEQALESKVRFRYFNGDSHDPVISDYFLEQNVLIDFLFIDGDHTYEGVKKDFELYAPLVRDGGLVAFHDIRDSAWHKGLNVDVARFWAEIQHVFNGEEIVSDVSESIAIWPHTDGWGGIGLIRMDHKKLQGL